jgi:hypothetical protein
VGRAAVKPVAWTARVRVISQIQTLFADPL